MNKRLLVIAGVIVCIALVVVIYVGYIWIQRRNRVEYFAQYAKNPVIPTGSSDSWENILVFYPSVLEKDGVYYLFYCGAPDRGSGTVPYHCSIGQATSTDGYNFTKSKSNPILKGAVSPAVLWNGSKWILYYSVPVMGSPKGPIMRATAPDPSGPWTTDDEPVLQVGGKDEWDSFAIMPDCVIHTDGGYTMYYTALDSAGAGVGIGRATSPDGITWTKYNNVSTGKPYAESDPILTPDKSYDAIQIWRSYVKKTATGWEMLYTGAPAPGPNSAICYATSPDGIHWTKFEGNPVTEAPSYDPTFLVKDSTCFLYYDKGGSWLRTTLCLATGAKPPFAP